MACRRVYGRGRSQPLKAAARCSLMAALQGGAPPATVEVAIGAVRNHCLTRLKTELGAIELYRDYVRLERHQAGDAADLG